MQISVFSEPPSRANAARTLPRTTFRSLLEALYRNDARGFRRILDTQGLPRVDKCYDYELLMRALRMNRKRIVNLLLNKKCRVVKPDHLSPEGTVTPLHLVAKKLGWSDVIEKMLKLGARVTDVNADGNTPLHLAFISQRSNRVVYLLLKNYVKDSHDDICNKDGLGFMHIACTRSDVQSVQKFFDEGFSDIHDQVSPLCNSVYAGYSPLHFAVMAGKHEIVQFLCCYDADVYAQNRSGSTPIHLALEKRDTKVIDILLHYDSINENYVNEFGVSHFMAACAGSDQSVVDQYIDVARNAKLPSLKSLVNAQVKDAPSTRFAGYSPLHIAAEFGRFETVLCLLGHGAPCSAETADKKTPLNIALAFQHEAIFEILRSRSSRQLDEEQLVSCMNDMMVDQVGDCKSEQLINSLKGMTVSCIDRQDEQLVRSTKSMMIRCGDV